RVEEPLRRVQHRGLHRPRAVQGHDGHDAADVENGEAGGGTGARALSGAVRGRGDPASPGPRDPTPQGGDPVVRRVHERVRPGTAGHDEVNGILNLLPAEPVVLLAEGATLLRGFEIGRASCRETVWIAVG